MNPLVYVVIITFNGEKWISDCLQSLLLTEYSPYKILIIDNASQDNTINCIVNNFPGIEVLRNKKNLGFAEGCNIGIRLALERGSNYVVLLNQDTKLHKEWLKKLVELIEKDESIGILSPLQYNYEGSAVDDICMKTIQLCRKPTRQFIETNNVIGAAMMLSKKLCTKVGGFDPYFFCYGEETDLCQRAQYHGFKIGIASESIVYHWHYYLNKENFSKDNLDKITRNRFICILKNPQRPIFISLFGYFFWKFLQDIQNLGIWKGLKEYLRLTPKRLIDLKLLPLIVKKRAQEKKHACYLHLENQDK